MIIFLSGKDSFRSRAQLKRMVEKFKADRDPQGLNVVQLDCEKVKPEEIWQQVLASPFLAERRMIVLEHLLVSKHKDVVEELLARIEEERLPEENVIMLWEATDKWKTKAAKALAARLASEKFTQVFDELTGVQLSGWIAAEVEQRGGSIARQAAASLMQHVGTDMWRLSSVIDQLIAYAAEREIKEEDVALFVEPQADDNIFNLVDAIVGGQGRNVFQMIRQQQKAGKDSYYIFAMLLRQFRILLQLRDLYERNGAFPGSNMAKPLGLHPFVLKKSAPLVKKYTLPELKTIYRQLLDIDLKTKTGRGDQSVLLDVFVGKAVLH